MLRTLLADRFSLEMHMEARDTPVFARVRARGNGRPGRRSEPSRSIAMPCARGSRAERRRSQATAGQYVGAAPAEVPSLYVALEEQLGLTLEAQRARWTC